MLKFFTAVLPAAEGWTPLFRLDEEGVLRDTQWFKWPAEQKDMCEWADKHSDEDLYFSPMLYTEPSFRTERKHAAKANVIAASTVYADGDEAQPDVYKVPPTINVKTSKGRWHNYWRITDTTDPQTIESLSHSVTAAHREDGVDNGWPLSKRLRVPGTLNTKAGMAYPVTAHYDGPAYTLAEFAADYEPIESVDVTLTELPEKLPTAWEVLDKVDPDPELLHLFQNRPAPGTSWYPLLYRLEVLLFDAGLSPAETFVVCRKSAVNKFERDGRPESDLWKDVQRAWAKYQAEKEVKEEAPERLDTDPPETMEQWAEEVRADRERKKQQEKTWDNLDLLDPEEWELISDTFIEKYTNWCIAQSAQSAPQYHEGAAFMLLAVILSEFGYVRPTYGTVTLNLFMMVLGGTTRSRKSTSLSYMLRLISGLSDEDYDYELPQDATPEALTEVLGERPGRSSLLWRDEVQALYEQVKGGGYMRGLFSMLTNAYDGYVNGMLRRTGNVKRTKKTYTSLNFFGMGILEKLTDVLEDEDFESGFLPRFIWIVDHGMQYSIGSADVEQYEEGRTSHLDQEYHNLLAVLLRARTFWRKYRNKTGDKARIAFTDEAWQRWQRFTVDLEGAAEEHPTRSSVLVPSTARMGNTVLKMSALLAMLDMKHTAELHHVLTAIKYATKFVSYMEYAARQVSMTQMAKDLDELEELLWGAGGTMPYRTALKHFKGRKTLREFNEMLEWQEQAGNLRKDIRGKTMYLEAI